MTCYIYIPPLLHYRTRFRNLGVGRGVGPPRWSGQDSPDGVEIYLAPDDARARTAIAGRELCQVGDDHGVCVPFCLLHVA